MRCNATVEEHECLSTDDLRELSVETFWEKHVTVLASGLGGSRSSVRFGQHPRPTLSYITPEHVDIEPYRM